DALGHDRQWQGWFLDFPTMWRDCPSYVYLFPFTYGQAGVAMFFVVSGFCIHLSYAKARTAGWRGFFVRRFFRIYPPYLVALILFMIWSLPVFVSTPRPLQWVTHLLTVQNLNSVTFYGVVPAFWSIALELQLYLLYPVLIWGVARFGWVRALIGLAVLEFGLRLANMIYMMHRGVDLPAWIIGLPFAYWFSWSLGAYVAQGYLTGQRNFLGTWRWGLVAAALLVSVVFWPAREMVLFSASAVATAIALDRLVAGRWQLPGGRLGDWGWRHLCFLGGISYSFYLFHQPLIHALGWNRLSNHPRVAAWLAHVTHLDWNFQSTDHTLQFFLGVASYVLILPLSWLAFRVLEQPSIAAGKWVLGKLSPR
ncbi:MAG TPA: acyltransferase, partial [Verrucomicrobiae bacterium]